LNAELPLLGVKVVLIDDSNTIRRSGEIFLTQAGCQVVLAEDGFDGLSKVVDTLPDIIFVDVMMPRLDGYQTCALIKNHQLFKKIPVVMLTSKDTLFDRARGKLVGSDQYLIKPFNKKSLIESVIRHTQQQER
jgi:twitching motility two-component system response regulator PilG